MKSNEVLRILQITRPTLTTYVKKGLIRVNVLKSGRYDYDESSVYEFLNKDVKRKNYIYGRVSSNSQKSHLQNLNHDLEECNEAKFSLINEYKIEKNSIIINHKVKNLDDKNIY